MEYPWEKVCCFTGHRRLPAAKIDGIKRRAEERIRTLYADGVRVFCVGGAVGFDTIIAELLFRLRETELTELNVVLCYPFDGFTENWMDGQKAAYAALLPKYDDVRRVSETGGMDAFSARNRQMVDMAAYCIAYCSNKKEVERHRPSTTRRNRGLPFGISHDYERNGNGCAPPPPLLPSPTTFWIFFLRSRRYWVYNTPYFEICFHHQNAYRSERSGSSWASISEQTAFAARPASI